MMHVCPVCGEETINTGCYADGDGDGPYTRSWYAPEIRTQDCSCDLTAEQTDAILAADICEPPDDY